MKTTLLIPIITLFLLGACASEKREFSTYGYDASMQELLDQSGVKAEVFQIDNSIDTTLFGEHGSIITIPKGSFPDSIRQLELELIEALDMSSTVLLNAQTSSNGKPLQTDGVVYVQAKLNGTEVKLKEDRSIQIEIPSKNRNENMTAFLGAYDQNGVMNWEEGNQMIWTESTGLEEIIRYNFFTIPLELFPNRMQYEKMDSIARANPIQPYGIFSPVVDHLMGKEKREFYARIVHLLNNPAATESPLATREFAKRLREIEWYYHIWYENPNGQHSGYKFLNNPYEIVQLELFNIYYNNVDKPLVYSDSLALNRLRKFERDNFQEKEDDRLDKLIELFADFKDQRLAYPVEIADCGVDLGRPDAYKTLRQKGINKQQAQLSIDLYQERQQIIENLKGNFEYERKRLAAINEDEKAQADAFEVQYYLVEANQLGWINVDRFYNSPNAKEFNLMVDANTPEDLKFFNVSLVLPEQDTYLTGYKNENGRYRFTKDDGYYTKLPMGEPAYVLGISYQNGAPVLGFKEIVIGDQEIETITATNMSLKEFKAKMDLLN